MPNSVSSRPLAKDPHTSSRLGKVRQSGTQAELLVRKAVGLCGRHYRVNGSRLPGRPDLSNKSAGWAIFVHGCFWHHHEGCRHATIPKHNRGFWLAKFETNQKRDVQAIATLNAMGIRALVVWECETRDIALLKEIVRSFLDRTTRSHPSREGA